MLSRRPAILVVTLVSAASHGRDERLGVKALSEGREFLYRLVETVA